MAKENRPDWDDIESVYEEVVSVLSSLNNWEQGFVNNIKMAVECRAELTDKQLRSLYTIYYQNVEVDEDALDDFLDRYNWHHL